MRLKLLLIALPVLLAPVIPTFGVRAPTVALFWVADVLTRVALPLGFLWFFFRRGADASAIGLRVAYPTSKWFYRALLCTLAYLAYIPVGNIAAQILSSPDGNGEEMLGVYGIPAGPLAIVAIGYYALSSIFEEIMFRGVLAYIFLQEDNPRTRTRTRFIYVVASSLLFAAVHFRTPDWADIVAVVYIGVVAALLYIRYRNLWLLILAHFVLNCVIYGYWAVQPEQSI